MMTTKSHNYECCMCGDHGLSYELFRCKVCHFRSQHRYCSNLYPKAESYRVCNWCLIQKDDDDHHHETLTTTTTPTSKYKTTNSPPSQDQSNKTTNNKRFNNHVGGSKIGGIGSKSLQPMSPIKKQSSARSPETITAKSPSGRKRISGPTQDEEKLRRTKSEEMSNINNNSSSSSRSSGGPAVIKHVFRNKVRRYKLLDEVSS